MWQVTCSPRPTVSQRHIDLHVWLYPRRSYVFQVSSKSIQGFLSHEGVEIWLFPLLWLLAVTAACTILYKPWKHLSPVYTIQPVVKRFDNRFDNRLNVCIHDTTGCQTRCQTGCQTVWQRVVSCIQPVVKPVVQPGLTTGWTNSLFVQHGCQTGCQTRLTTGLTTGCIV